MVLVEVGENIVAEMLYPVDFMNDEKPVFSSSSLHGCDRSSRKNQRDLLYPQLVVVMKIAPPAILHGLNQHDRQHLAVWR